MKKRLSCILTVLALLFCLTSCGNSGSESAPESSEEHIVSFETTDLKGNKYNSDDIFSKFDITMVNLWGTYCGPCIREMPDLALLDERLKEKNCAVIGIAIDVTSAKDSAMVRAAEDILDQTGVEYLNLVYWDGIFEHFPAQFIPTSYLVDSQGRVVGGPFVGAMGADEYEKLVDEAVKGI